MSRIFVKSNLFLFLIKEGLLEKCAPGETYGQDVIYYCQGCEYGEDMAGSLLSDLAHIPTIIYDSRDVPEHGLDIAGQFAIIKYLYDED